MPKGPENHQEQPQAPAVRATEVIRYLETEEWRRLTQSLTDKQHTRINLFLSRWQTTRARDDYEDRQLQAEVDEINLFLRSQGIAFYFDIYFDGRPELSLNEAGTLLNPNPWLRKARKELAQESITPPEMEEEQMPPQEFSAPFVKRVQALGGEAGRAVEQRNDSRMERARALLERIRPLEEEISQGGEEMTEEKAREYLEKGRLVTIGVYLEDIERQKQAMMERLLVGGVEDGKKKAFIEILRKKWGTEDDESGLVGFYEAYLSSWRAEGEQRNEAKEQFLNEFRIDFSDEEQKRIFEALPALRQPYEMILEDRLIATLYADDLAAWELRGLLQQRLDSQTASERLQAIVQRAVRRAPQGPLSKELNRRAEAVTAFAVIENAPPVVKQDTEEQVTKGQEQTPSVAEVELDVVQKHLASLDARSWEVIKDLLSAGHLDVVTVILTAPSVQSGSDGIIADIEGERVTATKEGASLQLYLLSRRGKRILIPLEDPFVRGFDAARARKVEDAANVSCLGFSPILDRLVTLHVGGIDIGDTALMKEREAQRWESFLRVLLQKAQSTGEEQTTLRELGILSPEGHLSLKRASWFQLYLRLLYGRGEIDSVTIGDLRRVAEMWDASRRMHLPLLEELRQKRS